MFLILFNYCCVKIFHVLALPFMVLTAALEYSQLRRQQLKMIFNSCTRKLLLLQLCFLAVSFSIYAVGIGWTVQFILTHGIQDMVNTSVSNPKMDDLFHTTEVWGLLICLSSMLYTEMQAQSHSESVFGAIYLFISTVSLVLGGDTIFQSTWNGISMINIESFNRTTPIDVKVILNLTGSVVKGLSWLLFIVQTIVYTHNLHLEDTYAQPSPKMAATHRVVRMLVVLLIYSLVILWTIIASQMDFKFIYPHYLILCYYSVTVLIAGCVRDDSAVKGVILSTFSVSFMTMLFLDIGETFFHSGDCWKQQQCNPVHLSIEVCSVIAGLFLWMYILEPFTGEPQLKKKEKPLYIYIRSKNYHTIASAR